VASAAAWHDAFAVGWRGIADKAGCITFDGKPYRALVRYVDAALEFHPGQRAGVGRCLSAESAKGGSARHRVRWANPRLRCARTAVPELLPDVLS
jgi:hypothetical protein